MKKTLLISGSPRKGNTEFILKEIFASLNGEKELVLLREKNLKRCLGCLYCENNDGCSINDDMTGLRKKLAEADVIVFGSPNYFDNVPGLVKDFIDRTNPFYNMGREKLKNKKIIYIITGGGKIKNSKRVFENALKVFSDAYKMKVAGVYYFKALFNRDVAEDESAKNKINLILKKINSL